MVFTLWRSKKAKNVVETEMSLSRQGEGSEKYDSNRLSRYVVRGAVGIGNGLNYIIPKALQDKINGIIPDKAHQVITVTIQKMVQAVLFGSKYTTSKTLFNLD